MMSCGYEGLDQDRHPMSSGATTSAGRQKKDWGRCWEDLVAMGVALDQDADGILLPTQ
ncbi:hypothetical protein OGCDGJMD_02740 [Cyanobium usitatum str. Tous]|nr:hypothetical protein OGCDGJMD_02740 [Cyanobium usitatum str. Tous]